MRFKGSVLAFAGAALLAWGSSVEAETFLDSSYGTPTGAALGRSAAMGATGVALHHGSQSLIHNPALLALGAAGHLHADFRFGVSLRSEDRLVPLFDSFESFVDETTIATNRNTYADAQGGVVWYLPSALPMGVSVGVYERYDFDFNYDEEVRHPTPFPGPDRDALLGENKWDTEGVLRSLSAGYGAQVVDHVNIGFTVHRYFGNVERLRQVTFFQSGGSITETIRRDLTGWGWSVGGYGKVTDHLDLGVAFEGAFTVDGDHAYRLVDTGAVPEDVEVSRQDEVRYPETLSFGLSYRPQNTLATVFSLEATHRFWENLEDDFRTDVLADTFALRDTWDFRLGLEHVFYNGLPVRFGFRYLEGYEDRESERTIFSAGIGYLVEGFRFDVTGLYHRQTSRQPFLFDPSFVDSDGNNYPVPDGDTKVEDSIVELIFAVSRQF